jgi:TolB-like protein
MKYPALALLIVISCVVGCGPRVATSLNVDEVIPRGARVAVLPFENLSGRENASAKITDYFVILLQSLGDLAVVEFGQTYEQMRRYRVRSSTFLTADQIDSLSAGLGAAYLVTGSVGEFTETDNQYLGKVPEVSLNVRVLNCTTKQTIWSGVVNARGDQGEILFGLGAVRSKDELARRVVEQAVNKIADLIGK